MSPSQGVEPDPRAVRAMERLAAAGVGGAQVAVEGHEREIAAVRVPAAAWERLVGDEGARLAAEIQGLGFRYVALDLRPSDG